jgi:hypothetical protein
MKIVVPHPVQTVAALDPRPRHLGFLQIVLRDQNDRTPPGGLARGATDCANNVFFGLVANGVRRVEAEAVEMKFFDPITAVREEKFANWS